MKDPVDDVYPEMSRLVHEAACTLKGYTLEWCLRKFLKELERKGWKLVPPDK